MKLVISRNKYGFYVYKEDEDNFLKVESRTPRNTDRRRKIDSSILNEECGLSEAMEDGDYFVFDLAGRT